LLRRRPCCFHQCLAGKIVDREIDFGYAWDFIDDTGRSRQLWFRRTWAPPRDPRVFDGTGQLVAIVTEADRTDSYHTKSPSADLTWRSRTSTLHLRAGRVAALKAPATTPPHRAVF
jgi:hypothetical protein